MEKNHKLTYITGLMGTLALGLGLTSCSMDEPFTKANEGEGMVRFHLTLNNTVTRAENELEDKCVVYISNTNGLLYKWTGLQNLPTSGVYLRYGEYLAEALCGDSVPASFTEHYLKGETKFEVSEKQISTQVSIECKLANVVTSIDYSELSETIAKSLKVEVNSSIGKLVFQGADLNQTGYMMMPCDPETGEREKVLNYTVAGKDIDGSDFEVKGEIIDVIPAHEYKIVLKQDKPQDNIGGANIRIEIREYELEVDETVLIHDKPEFSWANSNLNLDGQLYNKDKEFSNQSLFAAAYDKFESLVLSTENEALKNALGGYGAIDMVSSSSEVKEQLKALGIEIEDGKKGLYQQFRIGFTSSWLNSLDNANKEYVLNLTAKDSRGMMNSMKIRIATSEQALDAPFVMNTDYWKQNLLSIKTNSVQIPYNTYDNVENLTLKHKKSDSEEWNFVKLDNSVTRGMHTYELKDLEPNTSYDVQFVGGKITEGNYQFESEIATIKTEEIFQIPNSSMENWWLYNNKIWMPNLDASNEFWDSGNHGSTLIGNENDNLTTQFTGFYHEGGSCARLQSKFVGVLTIGKLGSGNIFTGKYAGTSGTNGKIDFGREYNGTHPSKVRVWVNYRPAKAVNRKGANKEYIPEGEYDKGQIYIALSDQIKRVDTSDASTLVTQEKAPELFLAYGEKTFEGDFGEENKLEMVEIPFEYFEKANTVAPKYLIIVCCASKYGDYFSGGDGSMMYVDDFELVYE